MIDRVELERNYWDEAALDPEVDIKYISDISTEEMLMAIDDGGDSDFYKGTLAKGIALDIGCGVGRIADSLHAVGIDISEKMLEIARSRQSQSWPEKYHLCDGRTIPFENDIFDTAYSVLLFQHLEADTIQNYIKETFRVLKPGGVFRFQFVEGDSHEGEFAHDYSYIQMSDWLREAGFIVDKVDFQWTWVTARKP